MPSLTWWQWALIAVGALVHIVNGANASRGAGGAAGDKLATVAEQAQDIPAAERRGPVRARGGGY